MFAQTIEMLLKNKFSILLALFILFLSLSNAHTFDKVSLKVLPNLDKVVHFLMYFALMSVIVFENWRTIKNRRHLLLLSLIPFCYGILMEILQTVLTSTRSGDYRDAIFNTLGIVASVLLSILLTPYINEKLR
jgi:VanZ family protein